VCHHYLPYMHTNNHFAHSTKIVKESHLLFVYAHLRIYYALVSHDERRNLTRQFINLSL
jgi:hypothetical protein